MAAKNEFQVAVEINGRNAWLTMMPQERCMYNGKPSREWSRSVNYENADSTVQIGSIILRELTQPKLEQLVLQEIEDGVWGKNTKLQSN